MRVDDERVFIVIRNDGPNLKFGDVKDLDSMSITYADQEDRVILYNRGFKVKADENIPSGMYGKLELVFG